MNSVTRILLADDNPEVLRAYAFRESFGQSSIRAGSTPVDPMQQPS